MSEESFDSAGKTAMQQQGSRFEDEFTENDLAMVNLATGTLVPILRQTVNPEKNLIAKMPRYPSRLLLTRNTKPRLSAILIKI